MRRIRNPEDYTTSAQAAANLRSAANDLAQGDDLVSWTLNISYATKEEIGAALDKAKAKRDAAIKG